MHLSVHGILYLVAFVCFLIATFNVPIVRINLVALGLAFFVLTFLV